MRSKPRIGDGWPSGNIFPFRFGFAPAHGSNERSSTDRARQRHRISPETHTLNRQNKCRLAVRAQPPQLPVSSLCSLDKCIGHAPEAFARACSKDKERLESKAK